MEMPEISRGRKTAGDLTDSCSFDRIRTEKDTADKRLVQRFQVIKKVTVNLCCVWGRLLFCLINIRYQSQDFAYNTKKLTLSSGVWDK